MSAIFALLLCVWDIRPQTDEYAVIDGAASLLENPWFSPDNVHAYLLGIYGNNYTLVLLYSCLIRLLFGLGIRNILIPVRILNVACIMGSILLTWLISKETRGRKAAVKVLVLCAMNPLAYGLAFWAYSNTISMPIMMGIIYVALRGYRAKNVLTCTLCGMLEGILVVLGFEIAVFPFLAIVICFLQILLTKEKRMQTETRKGMIKWVYIGFLTGIVTVTGLWGLKNIKISHFSEIMDKNYPITHWLMMGSHANGTYTTGGDDREFVEASEAPFDDCLRETLNNYRELGISGTVDLWFRKTLTNWSDGYSNLNLRNRVGQTDETLWQVLVGSRNVIFCIYTHAFRLIICLGMFSGGCFFLRKKGNPTFLWMLILTIAGGFLFYIFWEVKDVYSAPFLPIMFILAESGFSEFMQQYKRPKRAKNVIIFTSLFLTAFTVFICLELNYITSLEGEYKHKLINTSANDGGYSEITPHGCNVIEQDFYIKNSFNRIEIMADVDEDATDISTYDVVVADDSRNILYAEQISEEDIDNSWIGMEFSNIIGARHYFLTITKSEPRKDSIKFYTRYPYLLDSYRGNLCVDGSRDYTDDLIMNVFYVNKGEYYGIKKRIFLVIIVIAVGLFDVQGVLNQIIGKDLDSDGEQPDKDIRKQYRNSA